jgi:hypothetical protein
MYEKESVDGITLFTPLAFGPLFGATLWTSVACRTQSLQKYKILYITPQCSLVGPNLHPRGQAPSQNHRNVLTLGEPKAS